MTCRIGVDSGAVARLIVKHRPAQGEHGSLGGVEVMNPKMQVKLHGRRRVRPSRRLMARRSLERQVEACVLALAHRVPVCVRVDHRPPRQPAVEVRESSGIAAFQGDSAQLSNTTAHNGQPTRYERVRWVRPSIETAGSPCEGGLSVRPANGGDARTGSSSSAARSRTRRPTRHAGLIRPQERSVGTCTH
jgi:hypothetical protein